MQSTYMRNEIENVIKNHLLDHSRYFEFLMVKKYIGQIWAVLTKS